VRSADALAALDIWGCEVDVAGHTVTIPAVPAADWFVAILAEDVGPILPGLLDSEVDKLRVMMALMDGAVTVEELADLSQQVLAEISGWQWWQADRLIRGAGAYWREIGGELGRRGVDLHRISLGEALNIIYRLCTATMNQEERTKFEFELSLPPAGVDTAVMYDAQAATVTAYALLGPPPVPPTVDAP